MRRWVALAAVLCASVDAAYQCYSDISLGPAASTGKKGLVIDDSTLRGCPSKVPSVWPNAAGSAPVTSVRLVRVWDPAWPEEDREDAFQALASFAQASNVQVLVGSQVTCDSEADDRDWQWVKDLLQKLGPANVMGVAVGNEMELLSLKEGTPTECVADLWSGGRYWRELVRRVGDLDGLGLQDVPVTAVFSGLASVGEPFMENPGQALALSFLRNASSTYGSRFVFTFNFYSYFDDNWRLDPGTTDQCSNALSSALCWGHRCSVPRQIAGLREKIQRLGSRADHKLWVGETGWSSPAAGTLSTQMAQCLAWSSDDTFRKFYGGFLGWDLDRRASEKPDHAFYFSVRDSSNFGIAENFGLIPTCMEARCSVRSDGFRAPGLTGQDYIPWAQRAWILAGLSIIAAALAVAALVHLRRLVKRQVERRRLTDEGSPGDEATASSA